MAERTRTKKKRRRPPQPTQPDGPHGRLGVVWGLLTLVPLLLGPVPLAVWMAPHAALAGLQGARTFKRSGKHPAVPQPLATAIAAGLIPVACALGYGGALLGIVLALAAAVIVPPVLSEKGNDTIRTAGLGVAMGAAAGSLVLARDLGSVPALFLFGLACAHDTGAYLVGTGAHNRWEGPAAGVAALVPVTIGAAALAVPPFKEVGPWLLGGLAVVLAPPGPWVARRLLGTGKAKNQRVPAVRRLDSLVLLGPAWAVAAKFLVA